MNRKRKAPKTIAILALAGVGLWLYVHRYPTGRIPTACEQFTAGVAIDFVRPDWCKRIPIEAVGGTGGFSPKGFQIESLRSDCFLQTAVQTNNTKLCSEVKPIRSDWLDGLADGSGYNEAYCRDYIKKFGRNWEGGGLFMSNDELAPVMHQLGYTDQTLLDMQIDPNDAYSWNKYIHYLLWDRPGSMRNYEREQEQKRDFLDRVGKLRCKSRWSLF
jgi:hypothetical protein